MKIPYSEACERNKGPIINAVGAHFDEATSVLEIGSGTAQHAVHFSSLKPHLQWQTSDQLEYLEGINTQLDVAKVANVRRPIEIDVNQPVWIPDNSEFDLVFSANTFHIMAKPDVEAFFAGVTKVMQSNAKLIIYGPFKYQGEFTSQGNASFDASLRSRNVGSAIRDFEWINELASHQGLRLLEDHNMPANNQCLVWARA